MRLCQASICLMVTILQNNNSLKVFIGKVDKKKLVYKVMVIHVIIKTGFQYFYGISEIKANYTEGFFMTEIFPSHKRKWVFSHTINHFAVGLLCKGFFVYQRVYIMVSKSLLKYLCIHQI